MSDDLASATRAACLVPLVDRFTESLVTFDIHGDWYRQRPKPPLEPPLKPGRRNK